MSTSTPLSILEAQRKQDIEEILAAVEGQFDAEANMICVPFHSIGYHCLLPEGTPSHPTHPSIYYALALIEAGRPKYLERAAKIIRAVLELQITNPYDPAFGIWPWNKEVPVPKMTPPDWNWSGFVGSALCHMLLEHPQTLDDTLRQEVTLALERAAMAIFRRNVRPDYTNIALMGAAVTSAAGRILNNHLLVEYARERVCEFLRYTKETGGLNEYNSPTYAMVALNEAERILQLSNDPKTREAAEGVRYFIWQSIAEHFHPETSQLAGPHSRAYSDRLAQGTLALIQRLTGQEPTAGKDADTTPRQRQLGEYSPLRRLPCPEDLKGRFRAVPESERVVVRRFIRRNPEEQSVWGTTVFDGDLSVGIVNRGNTWVQVRPFIAYWVAPERPAVFKFHFLKDGRECSAFGYRQALEGLQVLTAFHPLAGMGDYHIHLDKPANGVYRASRLAIRYTLESSDVRVSLAGDGCAVMTDGRRQAIVHVPVGEFAGMATRLECGNEDGKAWVDVVLYDGPERDFTFRKELSTHLAVGVEFCKPDAGADMDVPLLETSEDGMRVCASWRGMKLDVPVHAG